MHFQTQVSGIPCQCRVDFYSPARPMKVYGTGFGDAHPPEPEEFHFTILDRKGYKAAWLEKKVKPSDKERLVDEFQALTLANKYGKDF